LLVTHSLSADGFDASEDGTGRGTPLVPVAYRVHGENSTAMTSNGVARVADPVDTARSLDSCGGYATNQGGNVILQPLVPVNVGTLSCNTGPSGHDAGNFQSNQAVDSGYCIPVAFESRFARNGRGAPSEIVPPLKAQSGETGKGDASPLVAFVQNTRDEVRPMGGDGQIVGALAAEPGMKQQCYVAGGMAVRRLTPRECERLQGVPDGYTLVERNGKPMADGPRYKMLGNGFAVPVVRWIGERLAKAVK
jgi:DNA (cytosine-5)-methyltransferase 1